jgi:hypothetical protein
VKIVHLAASRHGPEVVVVDLAARALVAADSAVHALVVADSAARVPVAVDSAVHALVAADSAAHVPVAVDSGVHRPAPEVAIGVRTSVLQHHRNGCAVRRRRNRNTSLADQSRNAPAVASTP